MHISESPRSLGSPLAIGQGSRLNAQTSTAGPQTGQPTLPKAEQNSTLADSNRLPDWCRRRRDLLMRARIGVSRAPYGQDAKAVPEPRRKTAKAYRVIS